MMKIEPPAGGERNKIKVTMINQGMQLSCEMTWDEWLELHDDARYVRRYRESRPVA